MSEREYNRALWSFIFLEMLVSSFCVQASSNSNGRHGRSGLCPHFPSEEPFDLVLALGLAEFPCSVAPLEAVPAGHLECWIRSPCISAVISHVQLFVTPYKENLKPYHTTVKAGISPLLRVHWLFL